MLSESSYGHSVQQTGRTGWTGQFQARMSCLHLLKMGCKGYVVGYTKVRRVALWEVAAAFKQA